MALIAFSADGAFFSVYIANTPMHMATSNTNKMDVFFTMQVFKLNKSMVCRKSCPGHPEIVNVVLLTLFSNVPDKS